MDIVEEVCELSRDLPPFAWRWGPPRENGKDPDMVPVLTLYAPRAATLSPTEEQAKYRRLLELTPLMAHALAARDTKET